MYGKGTPSNKRNRVNQSMMYSHASFSESEEAGSFWRSNYAPDPSSGLPCEAADFYRAKILHKHLLSPVPSNPNSVLNSQFVFISGNNINEGTFFFSTTNSEHEYALTEFIIFSIDKDLLGPLAYGIIQNVHL